MELDLGCREDVEVRESFSSPEELARYRGAAPNRLQCLFGLADLFTKSFQDIFVEGVITVRPGGTNSLCTMSWLSEKTIIIVFTLDLLMHAFFGRGELFVPFRTLPFGPGIAVEHP